MAGTCLECSGISRGPCGWNVVCEGIAEVMGAERYRELEDVDHIGPFRS